MAPFRDRTSWYMGLSAYWFATSFKWFILLIAILPEQVRNMVDRDPNAAARAQYNTQWGLVFAIGATWAMVGPSIFGYISDRLGLRKGSRAPFLAVGAGMTVIALAALAKADQIWLLAVGYLLLQISDDVGTGPYAALIPEIVPEDRRGRASGYMGVLQLTGQLASGLVGLALHSSPQTIYIVIGAINVAGAVAAILTIRGAVPIEVRQEETASASIGGFIKGWIAPWKAPDFRWVWFTRFLVATGFYLIEPYIANFLRDRVRVYELFGFVLERDADKTTIPVATIGLTIALFGALGAGYAAKALDRVGRKKTIRMSGLIMLCVLTPFAFTTNFTGLWCLAVLFGFGYGVYQSADWALAADVLPNPESFGQDMGVWVMSLTLAQFFAGGGGWLIDSVNRLESGWGYTAIFLLAAVAFIFGTSLVAKIKGST